MQNSQNTIKLERIEKVLSNSKTLNFNDQYIPDYEELVVIVRKLQQKGLKVVLSQGVYDLPHIGHLTYLEKARSFGDVLIIGVDSDRLTKLRKGPTRPKMPESERLRMIAGFRPVDFVTIREANHHKEHLVETIRPDVLVLSHTIEDIDEKIIQYLKTHAHDVKVLPKQATTTTSAKIRDMMMDGALDLKAHLIEQIDIFLKDGINKQHD